LGGGEAGPSRPLLVHLPSEAVMRFGSRGKGGDRVRVCIPRQLNRPSGKGSRLSAAAHRRMTRQRKARRASGVFSQVELIGLAPSRAGRGRTYHIILAPRRRIIERSGGTGSSFALVPTLLGSQPHPCDNRR